MTYSGLENAGRKQKYAKSMQYKWEMFFRFYNSWLLRRCFATYFTLIHFGRKRMYQEKKEAIAIATAGNSSLISFPYAIDKHLVMYQSDLPC